MTEWLPVLGFEGRYEVSSDGQVRTLAGPGRRRPNADRILKGWRNGKHGYRMVSLWAGDGAPKKVCLVHILVLEAFVGPRPLGLFGLHADDDPENNQLVNLRWGTLSENAYDMVANGNHPQARRTHCKHGHLLAGYNLVATPLKRTCRTCKNQRKVAARAAAIEASA